MSAWPAALQSLHFLRPAWLLALPLLWAAAVWFGWLRRRQGGWSGLIDAELLAALRLDAPGGKPWRSPWLLLALVWTLAALALAGPAWQREQAAAFRAPGAWLLVLDLSPSMNAVDLSPNRIGRARYVIEDLLRAAHDARVGLVVFSDGAYTVAPLTEDTATIRSLLPPLAPDLMPGPGDTVAPALQRAAQLLQPSGAGHPRVIVLSDGFSDPASAFSAAAELRAEGITLDVIGVGGNAGALGTNRPFGSDAQGRPAMVPLAADRLQRLATAGGGRYVALDQAGALIARLSTDAASATAAVEADQVQLTHWRDAGVWLLPPLLLLAALLSRRGWP